MAKRGHRGHGALGRLLVVVVAVVVLGLAITTGAAATSAPAATSDVIELNDDNFEHLTQASTGGTTGHWLVEFYAPWCGHCKTLAPTWEELATELKGTVPVAKVDATLNPLLKQRFNIRGFPTILFFKNGKMYRHQGPRSMENLKNFALGEYEKADAQPIPQPISAMDQLLEMLSDDVQHLANTKKAAVGAIFAVGAVFGLFVGYVFNMLSGGARKAKVQ